MKKRQFDRKLLASLRKNEAIKIRAGTGDHKFIRIWAIVVNDRVFVRSWSLKPRSWYRTFLKEPKGAILVDDQEISVRAVPAKSERLNNQIDKAYLEKYSTPGLSKYARDLGRKKSKATTTELIPG